MRIAKNFKWDKIFAKELKNCINYCEKLDSNFNNPLASKDHSQLENLQRCHDKPTTPRKIPNKHEF